MNIILQTCRMYSWNLLTLVIASIETPWSLIISFPSICRDRFRNIFRCATQHLEVRFNNLVWASTFFHNYLCQKTTSRESTTLSKQALHLGSSCRRRIHSCLRIHHKDLLIRLILNYNITQNLLETTTCHNTYSVVSTNLHGSLY